MVSNRDQTWDFASHAMLTDRSHMSTLTALALLCITLGAAQMVAAEEALEPGRQTRQSMPADREESHPGPDGEPPTQGKALESFKPSEEIPADSAVAFPVDI